MAPRAVYHPILVFLKIFYSFFHVEKDLAHRRKRHKISGGGGHKKFTSGSFQSIKTNEKYINRDEVNFNLKGQLLIRDRGGRGRGTSW